MPLYIGKKLDFLMQITGTSNAMLGRALNFDSSHISRIRADKRGVPHKQPFTDPAAAYFAKALAQSDKQDMAAKVICPDASWPEKQEDAAVLISSWLAAPENSGLPADRLLFSSSSQNPFLQMFADNNPANRHGTAFFYGNSGKREATLLFLSALCDMETPPMLLLYSDEDMGWFSEDPAFVTQWGLMLARYLSNGGKIRIIHNVGRDLHEMLTALQKWMPLYMYGEIEAYYYPKLRDQFLRRTLFIAKYHSALISDSIGSRTDGMANMLITHVDAAKAFALEFENMLSQCSPLMRTYRETNILQLFAELSVFENTCSPLITMGPIPPIHSLPEAVAQGMETRCAHKPYLYENQGLVHRALTARKNLTTLLSAGHTVTDILCLPDISTVWTGKLFVPMCDFLGLPGLAYTVAEFAVQLRSIVSLLRSRENYHVILTTQIAENVLILCKNEVGAFVFPATPHGIVFGINERDLTLSLWEFLNRTQASADREQTILQIENYIDRLLNFQA